MIYTGKNKEGYSDPTANEAIARVFVEEKNKQPQVRRGDVVYILSNGKETGSEQKAGRPAVIVSNDFCNKFGSVVEVVYLTSQAKRKLPTHTQIMCKKSSTALCEQITTVDKSRIGDIIRHATEKEMRAINTALAISIGIMD